MKIINQSFVYFACACVMVAQSTGTFTASGDMTTPRFAHTATLLGDGKVLIAGGGNFDRLASAEIYDPATATFSATGKMTRTRVGHTATLLCDGKVLIAAARDSSDRSAELYDPSTGMFTATGDMTGAGGPAVLLANGKVLIAGPLNAEIYDPATGTFADTGAYTSTPKGFPTATLLADGRVLIAWNTTAAELFDPVSGTFSATGDMTTHDGSAAGYTATLLTNGKVLVAGGVNEDVMYTTAELYDPSTGTFSATGDMASARYSHAATLLSDGSVLIAGGGTFERNPAGAELYDSGMGTFSPTGNMTTPRFERTATVLKSGRVLIAGGIPSAKIEGILSSAELYNPPRIQAAPVLLSLSSNGQGQGAILHAGTSRVASSSNPAVLGEALEVYCTGLIDESVIPPQVAIGGRMAEVLFFGKAPGFASLNQVNIRVPSGVVPGPGVPVRLMYLSRPSNEVTIGVDGGMK
jgi:Kelch motif/Galactose oxidase, central domain